MSKTTSRNLKDKHDPTTENNASINNRKQYNSQQIIISFKNKLTSSNVSDEPKTPCFYTQPKTHNKKKPQVDPFLRSVKYHTSNISECVDFYLQPIFDQIPRHQ